MVVQAEKTRATRQETRTSWRIISECTFLAETGFYTNCHQGSELPEEQWDDSSRLSKFISTHDLFPCLQSLPVNGALLSLLPFGRFYRKFGLVSGETGATKERYSWLESPENSILIPLWNSPKQGDFDPSQANIPHPITIVGTTWISNNSGSIFTDISIRSSGSNRPFPTLQSTKILGMKFRKFKSSISLSRLSCGA